MHIYTHTRISNIKVDLLWVRVQCETDVFHLLNDSALKGIVFWLAGFGTVILAIDSINVSDLFGKLISGVAVRIVREK